MKVLIKALVRFGSVYGNMSKGDEKLIERDRAESLQSQGLVEILESKPVINDKIETKPEPKKKGKGRK